METYTRELYRELGTHGHRARASSRWPATRAPARGHVVVPGRGDRLADQRREPLRVGLRRARRLVVGGRRRRAPTSCTRPATLGPVYTSMPTVVTIHDMLYWSHPELMSTPLYTEPVKWMEKRGAANATRVITDSQVSADEIVKYLGFPTERLHVVPLAATHPRATGRRDRARRRTSSLASGQRRPHKNWTGLIRALALVPEDVRPQPGHHRRARRGPARGRWSSELGLAPWVTLMGWVDDAELADLQARARVMAMPTLAEGFGLPVLEAMASGPARDGLRPAGAARGRRRRRPVLRPAQHPRRSPTRSAWWRPSRSGWSSSARPGWQQAASFSLAAGRRGDPRGLPAGARPTPLTPARRQARKAWVSSPRSPSARASGVGEQRRRRAAARSTAAGPSGRPAASRARASARPPRRSSAARREAGCRAAGSSRTTLSVWRR